VWSWDITALKGPTNGVWYKCYAMLDIFSRYVTGWLVAPAEDAIAAKDFLADAIARNGVEPHTIHADRGGQWSPNRWSLPPRPAGRSNGANSPSPVQPRPLPCFGARKVVVRRLALPRATPMLNGFLG
jgi:transposase InsO family protein